MWNTYIWKPVSTMWLKKDNCDFLSHNSDIFLAIQTFSFAILRYKLRIVRQSLELWDVNSEMWDKTFFMFLLRGRNCLPYIHKWIRYQSLKVCNSTNQLNVFWIQNNEVYMFIIKSHFFSISYILTILISLISQCKINFTCFLPVSFMHNWQICMILSLV